MLRTHVFTLELAAWSSRKQCNPAWNISGYGDASSASTR